MPDWVFTTFRVVLETVVDVEPTIDTILEDEAFVTTPADGVPAVVFRTAVVLTAVGAVLKRKAGDPVAETKRTVLLAELVATIVGCETVLTTRKPAPALAEVPDVITICWEVIGETIELTVLVMVVAGLETTDVGRNFCNIVVILDPLFTTVDWAGV
ncbi:hypothetical protein FF38_03604 [Lucilia cuprina]|uniref:Uncharacterized protein n=1 Tax=Lucilia cuprina TaxID=7375 RepID=A0A0L0CSR9_LUCCU|nr:hypothetical protein FF38_03414 [Lucilia cuprina]KNC34439.1 hypothetical protein FF38_03604 [Lucilia cuprina]